MTILFRISSKRRRRKLRGQGIVGGLSKDSFNCNGRRHSCKELKQLSFHRFFTAFELTRLAEPNRVAGWRYMPEGIRC